MTILLTFYLKIYIGVYAGLSEFNRMIIHFDKRASGLSYMDYGCYCGFGGDGFPIDETDSCCQFHDACWTKVEEKYGRDSTGQMWVSLSYKIYKGRTHSTASYQAKYDFIATTNDVKCLGTGFGKELCQCDQVTAKEEWQIHCRVHWTFGSQLNKKCFRRARSSYNSAHRRMYGFDKDECKRDNKVLALTLWTHFMYPDCQTTKKLDSCCGQVPYNSARKICCDGQLHRANGEMACCGANVMKKHETGCCNGQTYQLG